MGRLRKQPVAIDWVTVDRERYPIYRDRKMKPIRILNDYALYLVEKGNDEKSNEQAAYDMRVFWQYLDGEGISYLNVDDVVLRAFRGWSLGSVRYQ